MPYITQNARINLQNIEIKPHTSGELNYMLTNSCLDFLDSKDKNYESFNSVIGALEACKLEFYRRMITPYENKKIEENGDVY